MFGLEPEILGLIALCGLAMGGIAYAFLFNSLEMDKKSGERLNRIKSNVTNRSAVVAAQNRVLESGKRKKTLNDSLKKLEDSKKQSDLNVSPSLETQIEQAGRSFTLKQFYIWSIIFGFISALFVLVTVGNMLVVLGVLIAFSFGIPRWVISFMRKKRMKSFLAEFPNALDVMVRSIKSGLPLNDAVRLIAVEGQDPVKAEFQRVLEAQQIGLSMPEACQRIIKRVPLPEVNFFAIVITIQAQSGGNLSEALGNLSRVLRDRKKMKAKVSALSMEAKASAAIIAALPFIVTVLVYLTSPDYIMALFTDTRGHMILGASAIWMSIGVMVMRNMINFDL